MNIFNKFLLPLTLIAVLSCTGKLDPYNFNGQEQNQNQNQNTNTGDTPEETDPETSGANVDAESESDDNVANTEFDGTITITYNSSAANVTGSVDGVTITTDGAYVTATNSGKNAVKYVLTGASTNGGFKLYSEKKQAIQLSNLTLKSATGAAINNQSKKRTFVVIEGTNSLSDCSVNTDGDYPSETGDEDMKAAFFSEGQLCFSGSGSLTVNAVGKAGITSDDYVRFLTGANVTVNSAKGHGVRGKDAIIVSGGTVNVNLESTATGKKCFSSDSLTCFTGGNTTLVNKAGAGTVDGELTGAAGIKSDKQFVMQGGTLTVTASGKGCKCISGDEKGFFEGGTVICKATGANYGSSSSGWHGDGDNSVSSKAIKFDGNLEFSGATVTASCSSHEAIESKGTIYISGGKISATSSDDAFNSASTMTISGGVVYAYSTGNDGLDANGNLIIKGGTVYAIGCGSPEVAIDANSEQRYQVYIQGGNVIAIGGIESGASVSQAMISTTWSRNTSYSLCDGDTVLYSFKAPASGGSGLYMTAPSLVNGTSYTLKTSATVSGDESCIDGILSIGGTATGGSSVSVKASTFSSGSGMGGNQPGGGHGPGGW